MSKYRDSLSKIEETQAALRKNIEVTKKLAEQSDELIKRHHEEMRGDRG